MLRSSYTYVGSVFVIYYYINKNTNLMWIYVQSLEENYTMRNILSVRKLRSLLFLISDLNKDQKKAW